jgi:excinuclease ABC subunit A
MTSRLFSERFACPDCQRSFPELEPRSFSFNSPYGACPECQGLGLNQKDEESEAAVCPNCQGERLNEFSRAVTLADCTLGQFTKRTVSGALDFLNSMTSGNPKRERGTEQDQTPDASLTLRVTKADFPLNPKRERGTEQDPTPDTSLTLRVTKANDSIAQGVLNRTLPEIANRLRFVIKVGLDYLSLDRPASSLSGGEFQRARLAACLGIGLRGACYVLDEPTAGLHPRDTQRLMGTLAELRDQGNTVLVVEHDLDCVRQADWLVDLGPGAGDEGGRVLASGTPSDVAQFAESVTAQYLAARPTGDGSPRSKFENEAPTEFLTLTGARRHNLKNVTLRIPLRALTCVTGVSGSGKSSLISQCLQCIQRSFVTFHVRLPRCPAFVHRCRCRCVRQCSYVQVSPVHVAE